MTPTKMNPCKNNISSLLNCVLVSIDVNENIYFKKKVPGMLQLFKWIAVICMEETLSDSSADVQTHHSREKGCCPFYAFEPCTFTLPVNAY